MRIYEVTIIITVATTIKDKHLVLKKQMFNAV